MSNQKKPHDGENVRIAAAKQEVSSVELGRLLKLTPQHVRKMYLRENWTTDRLVKVGNYLNTDLFKPYQEPFPWDEVMKSDKVIGVLLKPEITDSEEVAKSILNMSKGSTT